MSTHEFTFGGTPFEVHISASVFPPGEPVYIARLFVWEDDGHALRAVGDSNGKPVEIMRSNEQAALDGALDYLARRFGPRGGAPQRKKGEYSIREIRPAVAQKDRQG